MGKRLLLYIGIVSLCLVSFGNRLEVFLEGERIDPDRYFQLGNTVYVHAVTLAESLGAEYEWNNSEKSLIIRYQKQELIFFNQSDRVWINDRYNTLQASPRLVQNRFFIPMEDFGQITGLSYVVSGERVDVATTVPAHIDHHNFEEPPFNGSEFHAEEKGIDFWAPGSRKAPLIVVDAGHGGIDTGATGPGKTPEKEIALRISLILGSLLEQKGYTVIMTRDTDVYIGLQERAIIANQELADLFISIHLNSFTNPQVRGVEVYFYDFSEEAYLERLERLHREAFPTDEGIISQMINHKRTVMTYSEIASREMLKAFEKAQYSVRGLRKDDFAVLAYTAVPSLLVECDFLSNPQVEMLLKTRTYQETIAQILLQGIHNYFQFLEQMITTDQAK